MGKTFATIATLGLNKVFDRGGDKAPEPPKPQPLPQAPTVEASADQADEIKRKKLSTASKSVYTSPLGVSGQAQVINKTLLGQ